MTTDPKGTVLGGIAIFSWGSLGALGAMAATMPPYMVLGLCFAVAAFLGTIFCFATGQRLAPLVSTEIVISTVLLLAYHLAYFEAFHHAQAVPVSLINYLWPAWLIVIGNVFFRMGSGLAGYVGAAIGFAGVAVLIGDAVHLAHDHVLGYCLAMVGAIIWATYCNLRRCGRHEGVGSMVTICTLASVICFAIALWADERFVPTQQDMLVILALGIGPAGGSFFLWDYGLRVGNAPLLSILGYSAPVLSTLVMVISGMAELSWRVAVAVALITVGGVTVQLGGMRRCSNSRSCCTG